MSIVKADPITTEVVRNFVISCAQDMNAALWRSAFSAIIYEGRDSAVALLDEKGNMLGQSTGVPLFVGAIDAAVKIVLARYGEDMHPGDIFVLNDSYLQGTHLHDVTAIGPLFYKDELVGFGAARAHWQDIGAIDPGSTMGSTSIFHEGLRLGPTRIVSRFKPIPEWYDLFTRNTRLKEMTLGDLNAQITSIRTRRAAARADPRPHRPRRLPFRLRQHLRAGAASRPGGDRSAGRRDLLPRRLSRRRWGQHRSGQGGASAHHRGRTHDHRPRRLVEAGQGSINCGAVQTAIAASAGVQDHDQSGARDHRRIVLDNGRSHPRGLPAQREGAGSV